MRAWFFSFISFLVAVPSAVKVFNWTATMYRGSTSLRNAYDAAYRVHRLVHHRRSYGPFSATMAIDVHLTDTYFVIAHFHYVMVGGMVMAYLGGVHFWFPKITGRLYPENWARIAAAIVFIGFNLTFFPQFILRIPWECRGAMQTVRQ